MHLKSRRKNVCVYYARQILFYTIIFLGERINTISKIMIIYKIEFKNESRKQDHLKYMIKNKKIIEYLQN